MKSVAPIVLPPQACALGIGSIVDTVVPNTSMKDGEDNWKVCIVSKYTIFYTTLRIILYHTLYTILRIILYHTPYHTISYSVSSYTILRIIISHTPYHHIPYSVSSYPILYTIIRMMRTPCTISSILNSVYHPCQTPHHCPLFYFPFCFLSNCIIS